MRRAEAINLTAEEIAYLVQSAFPGAEIESWAPCLLGGANSLFRFTLAGESARYVIRICSRDPETCAKEVAVQKLVSARVPVADIVHAGTMPGVAGLPYAISTWVEGVTLADALKSKRWSQHALGAAIGRVLAAIGSHHFAGPGKLDANLHVTPWHIALALPEDESALVVSVGSKYLNNFAGTHLDATQHERIAAMLSEYASAPPFASTQTAHLVHADFNPGNIIIAPAPDGAAAVAGVIDWEWAHSGTPLLDIAILLRPRGLISADFESAFAAAFTDAGGMLPASWRRYAATLDLLNLLELIDAPAPLSELGQLALGQLTSSIQSWSEA